MLPAVNKGDYTVTVLSLFLVGDSWNISFAVYPWFMGRSQNKPKISKAICTPDIKNLRALSIFLGQIWFICIFYTSGIEKNQHF